MFCDKKAVIWDLDNTLYRITPELADKLDEVMAHALVQDLNVPMDFLTCKQEVKASFKQYRDGGEVFYRRYGITPEALSKAYHQRIPVELIKPYENLALKLAEVPFLQYIFTASTRECTVRILKHIGLWEMFADKFYSVEDFGVTKKNEDAEIYRRCCKKIGLAPQECLFVDDSYSNLEMAKKAGLTTIRIFYNENSTKDKTFIDAAYKGVEECVNALVLCKQKSKTPTEI